MSDEKYIFIFEDGRIQYSTAINIEDIMAVEAGCLDIIDISGDVPKACCESGWCELEHIGAKA